MQDTKEIQNFTLGGSDISQYPKKDFLIWNLEGRIEVEAGCQVGLVPPYTGTDGCRLDGMTQTPPIEEAKASHLLKLSIDISFIRTKPY